MTRKLSAWNLFVKKIYHEGKAKNKDYDFQKALKDASMRKSEMKNMQPGLGVKNATKSKKNSIKKISKSHANRSTRMNGSRKKGGTCKRRH